MEIAIACLVLTVVGLAAAVRGLDRRLAAVQADQARLMQHLGVVPGTAPSAEVRALAQDPARRIEAIKRYRQQSGAELREARAVVESLAAGATDALHVNKHRPTPARPHN